MIRGTTPKLEFTLPFDTEQLQEAFVTFAQNGSVVLDKPLSECILDQNTLTVRLTQEDTLKLKEVYTTEMQIRARMLSGDALASNIIRVSTERILKDGVI